jgi:hypothetical protein
MTDVPLPFDEAQARLTDPETSHEAAASVTNAARLRWVVLVRLCLNAQRRLQARPGAPEPRSEMFDDAEWLYAWAPEVGTPDFALVDTLDAYSPSGVRTRRHELTTAGMVQPIPNFYARTETGRRALLWTPTAVGWRYWSADRAAAMLERVRIALDAEKEKRAAVGWESDEGGTP